MKNRRKARNFDKQNHLFSPGKADKLAGKKEIFFLAGNKNSLPEKSSGNNLPTSMES